MATVEEALGAARGYLRSHPEELARALRCALGLRFGVPLVALRWLGQQAEQAGKVEDLQIDSVPPGLRVAGNVEVAQTPLRAAAVIYIERVVCDDEELTLAIRLEDVSLKINGESDTPVAALVRSGALDLTNPGNLVAYLPNRSPVIAEAQGNRIVLDLMRDPRIANNPIVRSALAVLTSFVTLHGVEADPKHVDISFRALPRGARGAARSFRKHILSPSVGRLIPRLS